MSDFRQSDDNFYNVNTVFTEFSTSSTDCHALRYAGINYVT